MIPTMSTSSAAPTSTSPGGGVTLHSSGSLVDEVAVQLPSPSVLYRRVR